MAEDKYKTPPKMQEIYDKNKEPEFDKAVEDAVNTTERGTVERKDALLDAGKKKDLQNRLYQSMGFEVGAGLAVDAVTTPLAALPPVYAAVNFVAGSGINALAQLWRRDGEFNWGEVGASGAVGVIPGLGGKATLAKGALRGATSGVAHEAIRIGIDEKRLPTAEEALVGGTIGGVVGGGVTGAIKGGSALKNRLNNRIDYDEILDPNVVFRPGSAQDLFRKQNVVYGMSPDTAGKYYTAGIKTNYELTPHMQKKLRLHDKAFDEEFLAFDADAQKRRSLIDKQLDPKGPIVIRASADLKRRKSAYLLTGEEVTSEVDAAFKAEGKQILARYEKKLGLSVGDVDIHHKGLLRQLFQASNGLNPEYRLKSAKFMQSRLGHELGYSKSAAEPLPKMFHRRLHNIINKRIGIGGYNLKGIEKKLGLPKNWQEILTYDERLPIYREIIDTIADSEKQIKTFWNGLLSRKDLTKLTKDKYMETVLEVLELDDRLQNTPGIGFSAGQDTSASEIINDILIKAGRIDLKLPIFQKLSKAKSEAAAKIIMQENGRKALLEAVEAGKSIDTVFDSYGIEGDRKLVKSVMKTWKNRFPNQEQKLKKLIEDTDLEGKHADLKLLEKLIQDPDF